MSIMMPVAVGVTVLGLGAGVAGLAIAGAARAGDDDQVVTLDETPPAVRATIEAHLDGGVIDEIELSNDGEAPVYEVEVEHPGGDFEFIVAPDGTYLGVDEEDDDEEAEGASEVIGWGEAPRGVRAAFARRWDGAAPGRVVRRSPGGGAATYVLGHERGGRAVTTVLSGAGDVITVESELAPGGLPAEVTAAVLAAHPSASIVEAESVQVTYYEVEIDVPQGRRELLVLANGDIREDEPDDDEPDDDDDVEDDGGDAASS